METGRAAPGLFIIHMIQFPSSASLNWYRCALQTVLYGTAAPAEPVTWNALNSAQYKMMG